MELYRLGQTCHMFFFYYYLEKGKSRIYMDTVMSFDILFSRQALGNGGEKHNSKFFCQTNSCTKKGNKNK